MCVYHLPSLHDYQHVQQGLLTSIFHFPHIKSQSLHRGLLIEIPSCEKIYFFTYVYFDDYTVFLILLFFQNLLGFVYLFKYITQVIISG